MKSAFATRAERDARVLEDEMQTIDARLTPDAAFASLYRRVAATLALARARGYPPSLVDRLNTVVTRAHHALYDNPGPTLGTVAALAEAFPRVVRRHLWVFAVAAVAFFGPMWGLAHAVRADEHLGVDVLGAAAAASYVDMYAPSAQSVERSLPVDVQMFGFYVWNNAGIGLRTLGGGALGGVGALYTLAFNGVNIGATTGYVEAKGHGDAVRTFMASHSAFELTGIVLSGGAGFLLGVAGIFPGRRSRSAAFAAMAAELLPVLLAAVAMFVAAAFIEAFWSSSPTVPAAAKHAAGYVLWIAVGAVIAFGGRRAPR